jgi:hypothetical protein
LSGSKQRPVYGIDKTQYAAERFQIGDTDETDRVGEFENDQNEIRDGIIINGIIFCLTARKKGKGIRMRNKKRCQNNY